MAGHSIERTIVLDELGLHADEVWRLIGTAEGWREWLVDEADIDISVRGEGDVVDDGVRRAVRIEAVRVGVDVTFVWSADEGDVSRVTLQLDHTDDGRRVLRITESAVGACADCPRRAEARSSRWDLRECLLCLASCTPSRV